VGLTVRHTRISTHARTSTHTSTHTHIHTHTHTHTHPSVHGEASSTRTATHAHHHSTQHTATTGSTGRCEQVGGRDRGGVGEPTVWEIELEQPHMSVQVSAVVKLKRTGLHECGGGGGWVGGVGQTHPARTIVQPRTRLFARIFRYCFVLNGGGGAIAVPTASMLPLFLVMISMRTVMSHELRRFISFDLARSDSPPFFQPHAEPCKGSAHRGSQSPNHLCVLSTSHKVTKQRAHAEHLRDRIAIALPGCAQSRATNPAANVGAWRISGTPVSQMRHRCRGLKTYRVVAARVVAETGSLE
jgi:hypothetical protein